MPGSQANEIGASVYVCVCVCVFVFIKLHITAQPGPVKLIFQCYSNGSALWGISLCVCGHHFQQTGHQQGMVANSARGQLNRENGSFPDPVRA